MPSLSTEKDRVIEVTDLVTYYGSRRILNRVNLTIQKTEIMVIMGGSGSGKSTLLRHLIGLERAQLYNRSGNSKVLILPLYHARATDEIHGFQSWESVSFLPVLASLLQLLQ